MSVTKRRLSWPRFIYGLWLLVLAYFTLLVAWKNAREHRIWGIGDWLISYRGGFVRRGLIGEGVYQLARLTHIDPAYLVAGLQVLLIWLYMGLAYDSLLSQPDWRPYLLLLASPYLFSFHLLDRTGGFRKEILFFALLAGLVWVALRQPRRLRFWTTGALALYPLLILSHEMLGLFLPYVLLPLLWQEPSAWQRPRIRLLLAWNLAMLLLPVAFHGTPEQAREIVHSLQVFYPWKVTGAFAALDDPLTCVFCRTIQEGHWTALAFHLRAWALIGLAMGWLTERWRRLLARPVVRGAALAALVFPLPLFFVAEDWGRWVYIHTVAWFLLSLLDTRPMAFAVRPQGAWISLGVFALAYGMFWRLHHVDGFVWSLPPRDNLRLLWRLFRDLHPAFWHRWH